MPRAKRPTPRQDQIVFEREHLEVITNCLVGLCMRSPLENLHAGKWPSSETGDYSDVKVVTPFGEIAWNEVSRISDDEMKALMIEVMNKIFTFLPNHASLCNRRTYQPRWNRPVVDKGMSKLAASFTRTGD